MKPKYRKIFDWEEWLKSKSTNLIYKKQIFLICKSANYIFLEIWSTVALELRWNSKSQFLSWKSTTLSLSLSSLLDEMSVFSSYLGNNCPLMSSHVQHKLQRTRTFLKKFCFLICKPYVCNIGGHCFLVVYDDFLDRAEGVFVSSFCCAELRLLLSISVGFRHVFENVFHNLWLYKNRKVSRSWRCSASDVFGWEVIEGELVWSLTELEEERDVRVVHGSANKNQPVPQASRWNLHRSRQDLAVKKFSIRTTRTTPVVEVSDIFPLMGSEVQKRHGQSWRKTKAGWTS